MRNLRNLVFAIPTYNRSLMVADFLNQFASLFYGLGIDIIYYDSSENNDSRVIIEEYMALYDNIIYTRISSNCHANEKVLYIYKHCVESLTYNYIWLCGDGIRCSEQIVKQVVALLDLNYDMIIVNGTDEEKIGTREYTNKNDLFHDCAWYMTLFGAVIINVQTVLKNVPWTYIHETYGIPERINYSHVGLYFETISIMDKFRAFYLSADQQIWSSRLKIRTGWYKDAFKVLCECWPSAVNALPECYSNKTKAINKLGYYSCLRPWDFIKYRLGNVYNIDIFHKYRIKLKEMSGLTTFQLWSLARLNAKLAYYIADDDLKGYIKAMQSIYRLRQFCRKYNEIYIYGAGRMAALFARFFQRERIEFRGFVVTIIEQNPEIFHGHKVLSLSELSSSGGEIGIVIGLNQHNMNDVQPLLTERGLWEHSFQDYIAPVMLEDWKIRNRTE